MLIDFGKVTSAHGIKGEMKIYPYTNDIDNILSIKKIYIDNKEYNVKYIKFHKNMFIAKLDKINSIEEVEVFKNKKVQRQIEENENLEEDTYFVKDLIGMEVYLDTNELYGNIKDVFETGANDVYVISKLDSKEVLIPAIKDVVKNVDVVNKKMVIKLMEGLDD